MKELALQAGGSHYPGVNTMQLQRFYELVVTECATAVQDLVDRQVPASEYPDRLKEYFGVSDEHNRERTSQEVRDC